MRVVGLIVACGALILGGCGFLQTAGDVATAPIRLFHHPTPTPTPTPTPSPKRSGKRSRPSTEQSPVHRGTHYSTPTPAPSRKQNPKEEKPPAKATPTPAAAAPSDDQDFPTAKIVPDKPGYVFSPYEPTKYVDVTGYASGSKVKDPYTGKIFLVP